MKISTRYTVYSLVASAVPLGLVVIVLFSLTHRELERMRADDISTVKHLLRSSLTSFEEDVVSKLGILSSDLEWTRLLRAVNVDGQVDQLRLIEKATDHAGMLGLSYIELISADSMLIAGSGDYSSFDIRISRPALNASESPGVSSGFVEMDVSGEGAICFMASVPLFYKGGLVAYVQCGSKIKAEFLTMLEDLTGAVLELRSRTGTVISGTGTTAVIGSDSGPETWVEQVKLKAIDGAGEFTLVAMLPKSEVERLLAESLWIYAVVAFGGVIVAGVLGYVGSRHLTVPIGELVEAAENIAQGRFERRIIWFAKDELGTLVEGFNTMYDRLKKSQENLVQSEKIAAWNQMARKVAHELKNPLTPIQVSIEDLRRSYDAKRPGFDKILDDAIETISSEIMRLRRLTDEFSQFARLPAPKLERMDIRLIVADALRIYGEEIRSGRLRVRFPQSRVTVNVDSDLFSQVMVNLVKNALEAACPDGAVTVTGELGKSIVRIAVEDDGPGVPDDRIERLFTPYFTTKQGGTGLGLVIAYRIVFDHGGRIRYEANSPRGARFVVVLPLAEKT